MEFNSGFKGLNYTILKTSGIKFGIYDGILDDDSDQGGPSFESEPKLALVYRAFTG